MSKQLLVLYELMDDQIEDLKMCAKDYEIIFSVDEAKVDELEIVLGWWPSELDSFLQDENNQLKWVQYPYAGVEE